MRVPSVSSNPPKSMSRREPQQDRATRRLERFLEVAEDLFAEVGFEAATMTAVAERSGSSIGALYNYFPDKTALAKALLEKYRTKILALWTPLLERIGELSHRQFAEQMVERLIDVVTAHPAYLQLSTSPIKFPGDPAARQSLRSTIADALRRKAPALSKEDAMLCANVLVQMIKGLKTLYTEAAPKDQPRVVAEFQQLLAMYLKNISAR
ncbi:transcriptional regulator, TetR family [Terriglobus roseus]|uniref:Transcriptional regulator, TetR family n=2 Tax=Terriglobus roseus TaxID=392734 RepID=A0A1H4KMJ3_9BACT|nr:transcriptional regulator, TetR family [Terriglobus roseus]